MQLNCTLAIAYDVIHFVYHPRAPNTKKITAEMRSCVTAHSKSSTSFSVNAEEAQSSIQNT